jgi:hypothetical protein
MNECTTKQERERERERRRRKYIYLPTYLPTYLPPSCMQIYICRYISDLSIDDMNDSFSALCSAACFLESVPQLNIFSEFLRERERERV